MATKKIRGLEIFHAGEIDNGVDKRTFTRSHLDQIADAFNDGQYVPSNGVPLKVGHTIDSFNAKLAERMGIPSETLFGGVGSDGKIHGRPRFGQLSAVYRRGDTLLGDFDEVPEQVYEMVDQGLYSNISSELDLLVDKEDNLRYAYIKGVALVGDEEPAAPNLGPITTASFYVKRVDDKESGMADSPFKKIMEKLGLSPSGDHEKDEAALMEAMDKPKEELEEKHEEEAKPEEKPEEKPELEKPAIDAAVHIDVKHAETMREMQASIQKLEDRNAALEHEKLVANYTQIAMACTNIPGKPDELGVKWAAIHESAGEEVAKMVVDQHKDMNVLAQKYTVTGTVGSGNGHHNAVDQDEFEVRLETYAKEHDLSIQQASAKFATDPALMPEWIAYRQRYLTTREV